MITLEMLENAAMDIHAEQVDKWMKKNLDDGAVAMLRSLASILLITGRLEPYATLMTGFQLGVDAERIRNAAGS
jgi:hypothetical protein